jgi:hypothetical protein
MTNEEHLSDDLRADYDATIFSNAERGKYARSVESNQQIAVDISFRQTVSEGDIDWILCVELNCNADFRSWLASRLFKFEVTHLRAWRSISSSTLGESDLIWQVADAYGARHLILIENKIAGQAQCRQYERYVERGQGYQTQGYCDSFSVVLVAPKAYASVDCAEYEQRLDYEDMEAWFSARADERGLYLSGLLRSAIEKQARQSPPDSWVLEVCRRIAEIAEAEFPSIGPISSASRTAFWISKNYGTFTVEYKMPTTGGRVELGVKGAEAIEVARTRFLRDAKVSALGIVMRLSGTTLYFGKRVPTLNRDQIDDNAIRLGLTSWQQLMDWWRDAI